MSVLNSGFSQVATARASVQFVELASELTLFLLMLAKEVIWNLFKVKTKKVFDLIF
jgi:hypothetical protein